MFPRFAEDIPPLLTEQVLDAYTDFLTFSHREQQRMEQQWITGNATACSSSPSTADQPNLPRQLEAVLAPLELLYGKTFVSAVAIALHGAEPVVRYVEVASSDEATETLAGGDATLGTGRCLYQVGDHKLFSPYYCPCSAYNHQSIRCGDVWLCKHLLALRLAAKVEATGIQQDCIRVRHVPRAAFAAMLLEALEPEAKK